MDVNYKKPINIKASVICLATSLLIFITTLIYTVYSQNPKYVIIGFFLILSIATFFIIFFVGVEQDLYDKKYKALLGTKTNEEIHRLIASDETTTKTKEVLSNYLHEKRNFFND